MKRIRYERQYKGNNNNSCEITNLNKIYHEMQIHKYSANPKW